MRVFRFLRLLACAVFRAAGGILALGALTGSLMLLCAFFAWGVGSVVAGGATSDRIVAGSVVLIVLYFCIWTLYGLGLLVGSIHRLWKEAA